VGKQRLGGLTEINAGGRHTLSLATNQARRLEETEPMRYVRIHTGNNGATHFADAELEMAEADYRPPAPVLFVSHARESGMIQFVRIPTGWIGESITVPRTQFFICVDGKVEITVSDGEKRTFGAGDVVLMEDNSGSGHSTRVIGARDCVAAIAPVRD
jgi:quercetin dioxygenase-like cupin family protein